MQRAEELVNFLGDKVKAASWRPRLGKKSGQARGSADLVQRMLGFCEAENWTKIDELLQAGASRHKRA